MTFGVHFVRDDRLPEDHDFLMAHDPGTGDVYAFIRESAVTPRVLEDAWAAYRAVEDQRNGSPTPPDRRTWQRVGASAPSPQRAFTYAGWLALARAG